MHKPKKPFYATTKFILIIFSFLFMIFFIGNIATGTFEVLSIEGVSSIVFGSAFFTFIYFMCFVYDANKTYRNKLEKYNIEIIKNGEKERDLRQREIRLSQIKKENEIEIERLKNNFSLANIDSFEKILFNHQSGIDEKYILNFVLLGAYLTSKRNSIQKQFDLIINYDLVQEERLYILDAHYPENKILIKKMVDNLISQNKFLITLTELSNKMLEALINKDYLAFYKMYNVFDKLGIFNKEWENQLLNTMNTINNNLIGVMDEIRILESSISSSIFDLELELLKKR
jgi:hypothetical protein